jgi:NAD+ synthase (glutamine-hydrolysing)
MPKTTKQEEAARRFTDIRNHDFVRVAAVVPRVSLGSIRKNVEAITKLLGRAYQEGAQYAVCPELCLTGYTLQDLLHSNVVLDGAINWLQRLLKAARTMNMLFTIGLPLRVDEMIFNVAVTILRGKILGVVAKSRLPNEREFYEGRHFLPASSIRPSRRTMSLCGMEVPFGDDIIFVSSANNHFRLYTEVCEAGWSVIPTSFHAAAAGATVISNPSASNVTIGKHSYRRGLFCSTSGRLNCGYIYVGAGFGESTTDLAWDGPAFIAERGTMLAEGERFKLDGSVTVTEIDLGAVIADRSRQRSFEEDAAKNPLVFREVSFEGELGIPTGIVFNHFVRKIESMPYVPNDPADLDERCNEVFSIQTTSLARRLMTVRKRDPKLVLGVSGGRDSTYALLAAARTMDLLGTSRKNIIGITMPCYGTTKGTKSDALELMQCLGVTVYEISITPVVELMFKMIGHDPAVEDITFENCQTWARKYLELAVCAKHGAMDLGAGDLSELQRGYCTMYGDHASHFGVNAGVPKTLIDFLLSWTRNHFFNEETRVRDVLGRILEREISAELRSPLPGGEIAQKTEELKGPWVLSDFFGFYMMRFGYDPYRIARLALAAFGGEYSLVEIKKWLRMFLTDLFASQYKRSVLPDGPKVGQVSVSPRGDWRMPSDASPEDWLLELERIPAQL